MKHILVLFIAAASIFSRPLQAQTNASQITINRLLGLTENPTSTNTGDFADVGQNTILAHGGAFFLINGYLGYSEDLDISNNWFGSSSPSVNNFDYIVSTSLLTSAPSSPSFSCGSLFDLVGHKGNKPLSIQAADSLTSCQTSFGNANSNLHDGYFTQAYDTMENYITHCYAKADPQPTFGTYGDASNDTCLTPQGRAATKAFLLSALALRTDEEWFCACVGCFANCFTLDTNYDREIMSLLKWIADNPRCAYDSSQVLAGYYQERELDSSNWADTAHYPEKYDSSLLTMQQMGLDSVLIIAATEGVQYQPGASQILLDAHITTNPFSDATNLSLLIGREAYIHIGVYNLLGNQIAGAGYNGTFEQGSAIVPLNLGAVPQGIYYVRIQTANNETQTLKLVKE